jgi:hypothetical protein
VKELSDAIQAHKHYGEEACGSPTLACADGTPLVMNQCVHD